MGAEEWLHRIILLPIITPSRVPFSQPSILCSILRSKTAKDESKTAKDEPPTASSPSLARSRPTLIRCAHPSGCVPQSICLRLSPLRSGSLWSVHLGLCPTLRVACLGSRQSPRHLFSQSLLLKVSSSPSLLFSKSPLLPVSSSPSLLFSQSPLLPVSSSQSLLFSKSPLLKVSSSQSLLFSKSPLSPPLHVFKSPLWNSGRCGSTSANGMPWASASSICCNVSARRAGVSDAGTPCGCQNFAP